ncbi:MAG: hypothetical protein L6R37_004439 [Teloschistes peruensis]|nr:MAG: hypothetical protein L6R37_004439 [Teloschistes peruensis]
MIGQHGTTLQTRRCTPKQSMVSKSPGALHEGLTKQSTSNASAVNKAGVPTDPNQLTLENRNPHLRQSDSSNLSTNQTDRPVTFNRAETVLLPSPAPSEEPRPDDFPSHERNSEVDDQTFAVATNQTQPPQTIALQERQGGANGWINNSISPLSPMTPLSTTTAFPDSMRPREDPGTTTKNRILKEAASMKRKRNLPDINHTSSHFGPPASSIGSRHGTNTMQREHNGYKPSDEQMQSFIQALLRERLARNGTSIPGVELNRLKTLQSACAQNDHFYILLHQIHCVNLRTPELLGKLDSVHFGPEHYQGLLIMDVSSTPSMSDASKDWFAKFPLPFESMLRDFRLYREVVEEIKTCLARLTCNWGPYVGRCKHRGFPPVVDELVERLGIRSPNLQRIAFRATCGHMWDSDSLDSLYEEAEKLFIQHQKMVQQSSFPSELDKLIERQKLVEKYKRLRPTNTRHPPHHQVSPAGPPNSSNTMPMSIHPQGHPAESRQPFPGEAPFIQQWRPAPSIDRTRTSQAAPAPLSNRHTPMLPSQLVLQGRDGPPMPQNQSRQLSRTSQSLASPTVPHDWQALTAGNGPQPTVFLPYSYASGQNQSYSASFNHHTLSAPIAPASGHVPGLLPMQSRRPSYPQPGSPVHMVPTGPSVRNIALPPQAFTVDYRQPHLPAPQFFLPPAGQSLPATALPNPELTAIHQYRAWSPVLTVLDESGVSALTMKHFRYVHGLRILRDRLQIGSCQHITWPFHVGQDDLDQLSGTTESPNGSAPTRSIRHSSLFYRLRCIDATGQGEIISEDGWITASHVWPTNVTVALNNKPLEVRKKIHYGRDLPIDVTAHIQKGNNSISVSIIRSQKEDNREYAIGLEAVRLLDIDSAKALIGTLTYEDARARILQRLRNNSDPDIEVVDASVTLDLADPYTSRIWDTPIRGKACRHDQCFDLATFLQTRHHSSSSSSSSKKKPDQPCDPDAFRCPICGGDARPQSLVRDEFFARLRGELAKRNRLDAKAIFLQQNGDWLIKEEGAVSGEGGDGDGSRRGSRSGGREGGGRSQSTPATATESGSTLRRESEVIELDDD